MRNRLTYYSVALLAGLVVVSAFVLALNPFNGTPASASPATQTVTTTSANGSSSNGVASSQFGSGVGGSGQGGGIFEGEHHHDGHHGRECKGSEESNRTSHDLPPETVGDATTAKNRND